jgi:hypothetical protein
MKKYQTGLVEMKWRQKMSNYGIRISYDEWLYIDAEDEDEALKIAYRCTIDNHGQKYADFAKYETEQEISA